MRVASLDLGSNTFLLFIAEIGSLSSVNVLWDEAVVTSLSERVHETGVLQAGALERAKRCLQSFAETIKEYQVDKVVAVATSAVRDAKNREEFFQLAEHYHIPVQNLSGEQEASLSFYGATYDMRNIEGVGVVDIGGGSTEILSYSEEELRGTSLDVGSIRITEIFRGPGHALDTVGAEDYILQMIERHKALLPKAIGNIVAVSGTPSTLACLINRKKFSADEVHGKVITLDKIEFWRNHLYKMSLEERKKLPGMNPGRAEFIVAGLTILLVILRFYCSEICSVSIRGVRYGLALRASLG